MLAVHSSSSRRILGGAGFSSGTKIFSRHDRIQGVYIGIHMINSTFTVATGSVANACWPQNTIHRATNTRSQSHQLATHLAIPGPWINLLRARSPSRPPCQPSWQPLSPSSSGCTPYNSDLRKTSPLLRSRLTTNDVDDRHYYSPAPRSNFPIRKRSRVNTATKFSPGATPACGLPYLGASWSRSATRISPPGDISEFAEGWPCRCYSSRCYTPKPARRS